MEELSQMGTFWLRILAVLLLVITVNSESTHIWKCCFKGEQLHANGRDCVSQEGKRIDPLSNIHNESTLDLATSRPHDLYWLPPELMNRDLSVHYAGTFFCDRFILINADDSLQISFGEEMNVTFIDSLQTNDTSKVNMETIFEPADYCLEATDGSAGPWAIRMCTYGILPHVVKCCPQGQLIEEKAGTPGCVKNLNVTMNGSDEIRNLNTNPLFAYSSYSLCSPGQFQILDVSKMSRESRLKFLLGRGNFKNDYLWRYPCLDGGVGADGDLQWSVGFCSYAMPRHTALQTPAFLSLPAAALLAVAVATTLAQAQWRASTHGRALACHAGALLAANACNAAYIFRVELCQPLAIAINFFLLAAAFWLQVICINMARGFSQMLRSKRPVGKKTSGMRALCLYSLYAWGCPVIATIVVVSTLSDYAFSGPLYHTKTCFFEEGPISRTRKTNTFFYYYAPMCIILLMNIAMFAYTALKIRIMRKDTDILNRKEDGQPSGTRQSAVLYVKLLLLMGVLETAADVAAWASKNSGVLLADGARLTDKVLVYSEFLRREFTYRCVAHSLDLLRAASIFAICCCSRQMRAKARAACARWLPCGAHKPPGAAGTAERARAAEKVAVGGTPGTTEPVGTARTEGISPTNAPSTPPSASTQSASPIRRLPSWLLRPFRRRVQPNDGFSSGPKLSLETVVTTLDEEPRRASDSQESS